MTATAAAIASCVGVLDLTFSRPVRQNRVAILKRRVQADAPRIPTLANVAGLKAKNSSCKLHQIFQLPWLQAARHHTSFVVILG
jgi:hypothetical protein